MGTAKRRWRIGRTTIACRRLRYASCVGSAVRFRTKVR